MPKKLLRIPSPSLVISVIALVLAAGAGTFAVAALSGKDVKRIATKAAKAQVKKSVAPLNLSAPSDGSSQTRVGDLKIKAICTNPFPREVQFTNVGTSGGSLNWVYFWDIGNGGQEHDGGTFLPASAVQGITFGNGARVEGQFIFSTFDNSAGEGQETTVSLHALDQGLSGCEVAGTVQTASYHD